MSNRVGGFAPRAKLVFTFLIVAAFHLAAASDARAQEGPQAQEKAALVKELVELVGANENSKAIMNAVATQVRQDRQRIFEQTVSGLDFLSPEEREDLIRQDREDSERIDERVFKLFNEKLDLNRIITEISSELFDKYYTTDELKDLLAFYKSPTGRKSVKVMPQIFADSMAKTSERVLPHIGPIIKQIMDEEKARLDKIIPPKPRPKKSTRRRRI